MVGPINWLFFCSSVWFFPEAANMSESSTEEYELSGVHESTADGSPSPRPSSSIPEYSPYATKAMLGQYFPEADPNHPRAITLLRKLSKRGTMLRIQLVLAISIAVFNTMFWIWAGVTHDVDHRGVGTLFTGECSSTKSINSVSHLLLNGLSTLFLGAGNYCMQLLAAPSRPELESAHAVGDLLEIGVLSIPNLLKLPSQRLVLWAALGAISTALHLVWV